MAQGAWIGRSPHGPVVQFPAAQTEEQAKATAIGAYGANHDLSVEWSDDPENEVLLCDFCSDLMVVAWFDTGANLESLVQRPESTTLHTMDGVWAVCDPCRVLFEAGFIEALATRSAEAYYARRAADLPSVTKKEAVELLTPKIFELQDAVRKMWDGKTVPLVRKGGE